MRSVRASSTVSRLFVGKSFVRVVGVILCLFSLVLHVSQKKVVCINHAS